MDGPEPTQEVLGLVAALTIGPLVLFEQAELLPAALAALAAAHVVFRLEADQRH